VNTIRFRFGLGIMALIMAALAGCAAVPSVSSVDELPTSSDQTDVQKRASIRLQLAVNYYEQRQWKTALDEIKQSLSIDPRNADAYGVRALIYMEMKENRLAEDNFLHALKLSPRNPDISNNYGWFLCQNGREAASITYFGDAFGNRSYQSPSKALNNAGVCSMKVKQSDEALKYFLRAFQIDPNHPLTNAYLAKIFSDRRDTMRARFYLNRLSKSEAMTPDVLWVAIKTAHKLGERDSEMSLAAQLRRNYPNSSEYTALQREAFDD